MRAQRDSALGRGVDILDGYEWDPFVPITVTIAFRTGRREGSASGGEHRHASGPGRGLPGEQRFIEPAGFLRLLAVVMKPDERGRHAKLLGLRNPTRVL